MKASNSFEWPTDLVDFANSIEAHGGEKVCNLIRGPGNANRRGDDAKRKPMDNINIPFPSKSSRHRRRSAAVRENGVITDNLRSFMHLCTAVPPLIQTDSVKVVPICLSRDAMAIKPSGDLDIASSTLIGFKEPVGLTYVLNNPYPKPEEIKNSLFTEAGAIVAMTLDKSVIAYSERLSTQQDHRRRSI